MKRTLYITGVMLIILAGYSCSDDFLDKNNADWYSLSDTLRIDNYNSEATVMFELPEKINSDFTVFMRPRWLAVSSPRGEVNSGKVELPLSIDENNLPDGYISHEGTVILDVKDFGFVTFLVIFTNYGSPTINCSPSEIVFDGTSSRSFSLSTSTPGILDWSLSEIPGWLTFSATSGIVCYGGTDWIDVNLNTGMITPGAEMNATVRISSPHAQSSYLLKIRVTSAAVQPPGGFALGSILADAEYNHATGILAVCTKSPDELILYDTKTWESDTIQLNKSPNCISFSEDGHRAVIGYSVASVSLIDTDVSSITADYSIDCIPFDIVLGSGDWCYITPDEDQWESMRSLNMNTGQLINSTSTTMIYEKTGIKKIPGEDYMVGSRTTTSPSGILLFDVTGGQVNESVTQYHEELGYFWISKDGSRIYSTYGNVYRMPEFDGIFHSGSAPVYGKFETDYKYIRALDDCPAINSVFLSTSGSWYQDGTSSLIEQYNATSLNKTRSFNVLPARVNVRGTEVSYAMTPRFIFVNEEGTRMHVLKVPRPDYEVVGWFIETISLQ